jgi:hypothetical protein
MMRKTVRQDSFFELLMKTYWFKETVDLYFDSEYRLKYDAIMKDFQKRRIVKEENGQVYTIIKP